MKTQLGMEMSIERANQKEKTYEHKREEHITHRKGKHTVQNERKISYRRDMAITNARSHRERYYPLPKNVL
jgi:hypothetical protein